MRIQVISEVAACMPGLRAVAFVLAGDQEHADNLVEETITWFFTDLPLTPSMINVRAQLFSVLHDVHCVGGRKSQIGVDDPTAPSIRQDSLMSDNFRSAFWRLSGSEREMLILDEASGLSSEEVATACGCTKRMLDICVAQARQKLVEAPSTMSTEPRHLMWSSQMQPQ